MPKKVYKDYIEYICLICLMSFGNKKSNYEAHMNRKKPCVKKDINAIPQTPPNILQNTPVCLEIKQFDNVIDNNNNGDNIASFPCEFCHKTFTKKYSLTRHLDGRCKEKIDKNNLEQDNKIKLDLILERLKDLENENEKLKKQMKKTKTNSKPNININQNNINPNININVVNNNIVNFNDMNYNNVDKKLFVGPILDRRLFGKAIILKMIENIYINENLPEYQNLVITDKNRGYVKIYNNGKWKTDNIKTIDLVLNGIVEHSKLILDELYQIYLNNNQVQNRLITSEKYINYCDLEHLDELKDEQDNEDVDNKHEIKRCIEFRDMVLKDTINLFHDNKNILLKPKKSNLIGLL